ncbi:MAG: PqqD family protein [Eubacteriales bacterium]
MKIKEGFVRKTIAGSEVILAVGDAAEKFNGTITLNGSGKLLWTALEQGTDADSLVKLILDRYQIDETTAKADVEKFLATLRKYSILDE